MFGREFWVAIVNEFERSELTQERFARQRGVPVATLRTWIYKLRISPIVIAETAAW